ncbi:MAG: TadE/TadG family type IV pilus assembly protein [Pseudomonadota bacterium]
MRTKLRNTFRRFLDESGAATVEFVVIFPIFFVIFVSSFEMAMMNIRSVMLERATDIVVREIRINQGADYEYEDVRRGVCSLAVMVPDCEETLRIELSPVDTDNWGLLGAGVDCVDKREEINPVVNFTNGVENELMLVRVCAVVNPFFPTVGLGRTMPKNSDGAYFVIASSAFVNEPD